MVFDEPLNIGIEVVRSRDLEALGEALIRASGYIRVYTKTPDGKVSSKAILLPRGSNLEDLVERLEGILKAKRLGRIEARVRGKSVRFPGQRVGRSHVLCDGDIVRVLSI